MVILNCAPAWHSKVGVWPPLLDFENKIEKKYIPNIKYKEVLGRTNGLLSFDMTWTA
jgi:hypothetical protein